MLLAYAPRVFWQFQIGNIAILLWRRQPGAQFYQITRHDCRSESSARVARYSATLFTTATIPKPPTKQIDRVNGPSPCKIVKVPGAINCKMPTPAAAIKNSRIT